MRSCLRPTPAVCLANILSNAGVSAFKMKQYARATELHRYVMGECAPASMTMA